jgi:hypothetical protein
MNIYSINAINLNKLYSACCILDNSNGDSPSKSFGDDFVYFLNHVEISLALINVTPFDAFLLKNFASSCSRLYERSFSANSGELTPELKKYAKVINDIMTDDNVSDKDDFIYLNGPSNLTSGKMTVTFTGINLYTFFTLKPKKFFIEASDKACLDASDRLIPDFNFNTTQDNPILDKILGYISTKFHSEFRKFANKFLTNVDIFSDSAIYTYFSNHKDLVKLASVTNPCIDIQFDTITNEKYHIAIDNYKDSAPNYVKKNRLTNTNLEFSIYSNFSTFLQLYELLPKSFFISMDDLKVPFKTIEIEIPNQFRNYEVRLTNRISDIIKARDEAKEPYDKCNYMFLNSKIYYSLKFTFNDVNYYINPLLKEEGLFEEVRKIINSIIRYSKGTYTILG